MGLVSGSVLLFHTQIAHIPSVLPIKVTSPPGTAVRDRRCHFTPGKEGTTCPLHLLLLLWVWLQKALPRHITPGFPLSPVHEQEHQQHILNGWKAAGKGDPMGGSSTDGQTTAVLKELAPNRGARCEAHLAPGKLERKQKHPSAHQLLGFGIQTLPN